MCEKDGEAACNFVHWFDEEHPLHLKQSLRELCWCEIYENEERREEQYAINMQPSLAEVQRQATDRVGNLRARLACLSEKVQELAVELQNIAHLCDM